MKTNTIHLLTLLITLSACGRARYRIHADPAIAGPVDTFGDGAGRETVCDPFSQENIVNPSFGLKGTIHYLEPDQTRFQSSTQYVEQGTKLNAELFMNRLNVPTRAFTNGFAGESGDPLKKEDGQVLTEYFGLDLKSSLALGAGNAPGRYQLAILSDDGSSLRVENADGTWQTIVNNEGNHPTRLACATTALDLTATSRVKMNLSYFQGRKYHISLMVLWRPWPTSASAAAEPLCGQFGNDLYFDSTKVPSEPKQAYRDLLARGWRPLNHDNFVMQDGFNKCSTVQSANRITRSF